MVFTSSIMHGRYLPVENMMFLRNEQNSLRA